MTAAPRKAGLKSYVIAALILALAVIVGFELFGRAGKSKAPPLPPIVRTLEIQPASEWETRIYPGIAKESRVAKLSFRVAGKLIESDMKIGTRIEKDGIVARLDPRDYELAVSRIEAELEAAQSLLSAMKTGARPEDVRSLQSQLTAATSALETAEANFKRFTALLADQVASQAQYDQAKTAYDTAKGQKETLENELKKATTGARQEDIEAMESKILGLQAGLKTSKNALEDTVLQAPFDGMIVEKFIEDYEVVAPGIPVVSFISVSQIDVAVSLPEETIVRLDDIRGYRVEFEAHPGRQFPATLKELGLAVQHGRQSYPLQVRIDLPKEENCPIFPGMAASVMIDLAQPDSSEAKPLQTVPLSALNGDHGHSAVMVVEAADGETHRVVRYPVKIVRVTDGVAEIEGELPNKRIVVAGARFLVDGQIVRLEEDRQSAIRR